jgi:hypothetical protein
MKARLFAGAVACLCLVLPASAAAAELSSTFDASTEGWFSANTDTLGEAELLFHSPTNGNPGGYVYDADDEPPPTDDLTWTFRAPDSWEGDRSANYLGSIEFELRAQSATPPQLPVAVYLTKDDNSVLESPFVQPPPANVWTAYSLPISTASFGEPDNKWQYYPPGSNQGAPATAAQIQEVLGDLGGISIIGDVSATVGDETGIDNIRLTELDSDGDGVVDPFDDCPDVPAPPGDEDGCPPPDTDGDGIPDALDTCPAEPAPGSTDGCLPPLDSDGDGIFDKADNCPGDPFPGTPDGCRPPPDFDADGVADERDECPAEAGPSATAGCPIAGGKACLAAKEKLAKAKDKLRMLKRQDASKSKIERAKQSVKRARQKVKEACRARGLLDVIQLR